MRHRTHMSRTRLQKNQMFRADAHDNRELARCALHDPLKPQGGTQCSQNYADASLTPTPR